MFKKSIIAISSVAAIYSGAALASPDGAQTGLTLGGQIGYSQFAPGKDRGGIKNGNVYAGFSLGYDFAVNKMMSVGVETGTNYGFRTGRAPNVRLDTQDYPVLANVKLFPLDGKGLNVFGKAGYNFMIQRGAGSSISKWRPELAAGVGYKIMQFNIFAQYSHIFGTKFTSNSVFQDDNTASLNTLTLGFTYTFPM